MPKGAVLSTLRSGLQARREMTLENHQKELNELSDDQLADLADAALQKQAKEGAQVFEQSQRDARQSLQAAIADCLLDQPNPEDLNPEWSATNSLAAQGEGWTIFQSQGSDGGPWQIQRLDDASDVPGAPQLEDDKEAWRLVLQGRGAHHAAALTFIKAHNEAEYENIMVFAEQEDIICYFVPGFSRMQHG